MRIRNLFWWVTVAVTLLYMSGRSYSAPIELQAVCEIQEAGGQGSGTLIATNDTIGLILTCRHVAKYEGNKEKFLWLNAGGQATFGRTIAVVPDTTDVQWETDLALAICKKPKGVIPAKVAAFDSADGPWYGVGFVSDHLNIVMSEHCAYKNGVIIFDRPFIPGQSGGCVFNRRGELVAVIVAYSNKYQIGIACDGENLRKLLAKYGF